MDFVFIKGAVIAGALVSQSPATTPDVVLELQIQPPAITQPDECPPGAGCPAN